MYTEDQQRALKKLEEYLEEASEAQLEEDRQSVSQWSGIGPHWKTYISDLSKILAIKKRPVNQIRVRGTVSTQILYTTSPEVYERRYNQPLAYTVQEAGTRYSNETSGKN